MRGSEARKSRPPNPSRKGGWLSAMTERVAGMGTESGALGTASARTHREKTRRKRSPVARSQDTEGFVEKEESTEVGYGQTLTL